MKIYNEVITQFNDLTGQWETLYEDSFNYQGGDIMLAQGMPPNASAINTSDTIADTIKTTAGYFTNGDGTLAGTDIHTGSLAESNEKYYFNVVQTHPLTSSAEVQFSVTYGHVAGSGSDTHGDGVSSTTLKGQTMAIYNQLTNLLLEETEASGGFKIAQSGTDKAGLSSGDRDPYVYALMGKRNRFKDRINKKAWTISFTGITASNSAAGDDAFSYHQFNFTDDSKTVPAVATPGGPRHNIVSGALGVVDSTYPASVRTYGWFYPEMGIMLFSGTMLSQSIGGTDAGTHMTASFDAGGGQSTVNSGYVSCSGFAPNDYSRGNSRNALRMINCMRNVGSTTALRLRSEEDQTQENYFCRIRATEYNFSANPTFVSGSKNKIRNLDMHGNPQTFITGAWFV